MDMQEEISTRTALLNLRVLKISSVNYSTPASVQ